MVEELWAALGGKSSDSEALSFDGFGELPSLFRVTDLAASSIGVAALAVSELTSLRTGRLSHTVVDRRMASFWFGYSIQPIGWSLPAPWDPIAGDYRCRDGWIRLHTNAPHHRVAAESVLGFHDDRSAMARCVAEWGATDLESAVVQAGGCAAEMRTVEAWSNHSQGSAVAQEPLVGLTWHAADGRPMPPGPLERPLAGVRVLDLTRVLAGPVSTRFLAAYGADVLRIDPIDWDEPGVVPEVTLGKRCARLDLRASGGRDTLLGLLREADVMVHGYRSDALERLVLGESFRREICPDLIDVSLDAYGWSGPWVGRRGFDSLVQMSSGIAHAGMAWKGVDVPAPLPVQALDHATGYLMAAAAVRGLTRRISCQESVTAKLSLARTAKFLIDSGQSRETDRHAEPRPNDFADRNEKTPWGDSKRLHPPVSSDTASMAWDRPAGRLGASAPVWLER